MAVNIIFNNKEAKNKEDLIKEINNQMEIPSQGVCVIFFAKHDNGNRPINEQPYNIVYSLEGFYKLNHHLGGNHTSIPWPMPLEIHKTLKAKFGHEYREKFDHFIWISKNICEAEDIEFAWVYSHELQHLKQSLKNPYLLLTADLLKNVKYEIKDIDIPTEFECEAKAKQIIIAIYGEKKCISYLKIKRAGGTYNHVRYSKLLKLSIPPDFNVESKIQQVIRTNMNTFKRIQNERQNDDRTNWNIDIDKLCSCCDPHDAIMSAVTRGNKNGVSS